MTKKRKTQHKKKRAKDLQPPQDREQMQETPVRDEGMVPPRAVIEEILRRRVEQGVHRYAPLSEFELTVAAISAFVGPEHVFYSGMRRRERS